MGDFEVFLWLKLFEHPLVTSRYIESMQILFHTNKDIHPLGMYQSINDHPDPVQVHVSTVSLLFAFILMLNIWSYTLSSTIIGHIMWRYPSNRSAINLQLISSLISTHSFACIVNSIDSCYASNFSFILLCISSIIRCHHFLFLYAHSHHLVSFLYLSIQSITLNWIYHHFHQFIARYINPIDIGECILSSHSFYYNFRQFIARIVNSIDMNECILISQSFYYNVHRLFAVNVNSFGTVIIFVLYAHSHQLVWFICNKIQEIFDIFFIFIGWNPEEQTIQYKAVWIPRYQTIFD